MQLTDDEYFNSAGFKELLSNYEAAASNGSLPFMDADDLVDIADYYRLHDQMGKAMEAASKAMTLFPHATLPNVFMARNALSTGNISEAAYYVGQIENHDDLDYQYIEAELLIYQHKINEAEQLIRGYFKDVVPEDHNNFVKDVSNLYLDYGEYQKALEWLMRGHNIDDDDYNELMGRSLYGVGRFEECEKIFTKLTDKYPFKVKYWNALADAQLACGKDQDAITNSEFAIAIEPTNSTSLSIKGTGLIRLRNFGEAAKYFEQAHQQDPNDITFYLQLAVCYVECSQAQKAIDILDEALKRKEILENYEVFIYNQQALCYSALGQIDKAMQCLDRAQQQGCDSSEIYIARGHVLLEAKRYDEADAMFERALKSSFQPTNTLMRIAMALITYDRFLECYLLLGKRLSIVDEHCVDGFSYMALCCLKLNRKEDFLLYLRLAAERNPAELREVLGPYFPEDLATKDYYQYSYNKLNKQKK